MTPTTFDAVMQAIRDGVHVCFSFADRDEVRPLTYPDEWRIHPMPDSVEKYPIICRLACLNPGQTVYEKADLEDEAVRCLAEAEALAADAARYRLLRESDNADFYGAVQDATGHHPNEHVGVEELLDAEIARRAKGK